MKGQGSVANCNFAGQLELVLVSVLLCVPFTSLAGCSLEFVSDCMCICHNLQCACDKVSIAIDNVASLPGCMPDQSRFSAVNVGLAKRIWAYIAESWNKVLTKWYKNHAWNSERTAD